MQANENSEQGTATMQRPVVPPTTTMHGEAEMSLRLPPEPEAVPSAEGEDPFLHQADLTLSQIKTDTERTIQELLHQKQVTEARLSGIHERLSKFGVGPDGTPAEVTPAQVRHVGNGRRIPRAQRMPRGATAEAEPPRTGGRRAGGKNGRTRLGRPKGSKNKVKAQTKEVVVKPPPKSSGERRPRGSVKNMCVKIVSRFPKGVQGKKITEQAEMEGLNSKDVSGGLQAARRSFQIAYLTPDGKEPATGKGGVYFPATAIAENVMKKVVRELSL